MSTQSNTCKALVKSKYNNLSEEELTSIVGSIQREFEYRNATGKFDAESFKKDIFDRIDDAVNRLERIKEYTAPKMFIYDSD